MNEFKSYHPLVNFLYFLFVIGFSMIFMNPMCLFVAFFCGLLYSLILGRRKTLRLNPVYLFSLCIAAAIINPLFNHKGATILAYFPNGNPFTLESAVYGFAAAIMLMNVILWFSCYNEIMTSDKFIYIFGKILPSLSLVFSMTLRFIPRFSAHLKKTTDARKCIGMSLNDGKITARIKNGLSVLSASVTWALENSVEISDSMKARGYGLKGRTAFSTFKFEKRDKLTLIYILFLSFYIIFGALKGKIRYSYFPVFSVVDFTPFGISLYIAYFGLFIMPVVIEFAEVLKWKYLKSKI